MIFAQVKALLEYHTNQNYGQLLGWSVHVAGRSASVVVLLLTMLGVTVGAHPGPGYPLLYLKLSTIGLTNKCAQHMHIIDYSYLLFELAELLL